MLAHVPIVNTVVQEGIKKQSRIERGREMEMGIGSADWVKGTSRSKRLRTV